MSAGSTAASPPSALRPEFRAFISYSHKDRQQAGRLHRRLEAYRFPEALRAAHPDLPESLAPVFKDRDDLQSGGSLSGHIQDALSRSRALIVLCSSSSAVSPWVDREVSFFVTQHGTAAVYAAVVDGNAGAAVGDADNPFPPELWRLFGDASGSLDLTAADFRKEGDGERLALLKLIAGLSGVPVDALVRREDARRLRRTQWLAGIGIALTLTFAALGAAFYFQRREAERQRDLSRQVRDLAQRLNTFMIGDLHEKLRDVGRLDILDEATTKVREYHEQLPAELLDDPQVQQDRAVAWDYLGQIAMERGRIDEATTLLRTSRNSWRVQSHDKPDDREAVLGLVVNLTMLGEAQSAAGHDAEAVETGNEGLAVLDDWAKHHPDDSGTRLAKVKCQLWRMVAHSLERTGRWKDALHHYDQAADLANRAIEARPKDPALLHNVISSFCDLAAHYTRIGDHLNALKQAGAAVEAGRLLMNNAPDSSFTWKLHSNGLGLQAGALIKLSRWDEARRALDECLDLHRRLVSRDPSNPALLLQEARTLDDLGLVEQGRKRFEEALRHYAEAGDVFGKLALQHPGRSDWRRDWAICLSRQAELAFVVGAFATARDLHVRAAQVREPLLSESPSDLSQRVQIAVSYASASEAADKVGATEKAAELLDQARDLLAAPGVSLGDNHEAVNLLRRIQDDLAHRKAESPDDPHDR